MSCTKGEVAISKLYATIILNRLWFLDLIGKYTVITLKSSMLFSEYRPLSPLLWLSGYSFASLKHKVGSGNMDINGVLCVCLTLANFSVFTGCHCGKVLSFPCLCLFLSAASA